MATKINDLWFPGEKISSTRLNKSAGTADSVIDEINPLERQVRSNTQAVQSINSTKKASKASATTFNDSQTAEQKVMPIESKNIGTVDELEVLIDDDNLDLRRIPMMGGQPAILFGAGTPQESIVPDNWIKYDPETDTGFNWIGLPTMVDQIYINTTATGGGCKYRAVKSTDSNRLKWQNV